MDNERIEIDKFPNFNMEEKHELDESLELMKQGVLNMPDSPDEESGRTAFSYFLKAAELGNSQALYWVAKFYEYGMGVKPNPKEVRRYLTLAANAGYTKAINELSHLEKYKIK